MKRILITICTLFACVMLSVAQGDSYKITGQVGNSVNGKLLLVALTEKGLIDIGEAEVTNGVFEFTGRMSETTLAYLMPVQRNAAAKNSPCYEKRFVPLPRATVGACSM